MLDEKEVLEADDQDVVVLKEEKPGEEGRQELEKDALEEEMDMRGTVFQLDDSGTWPTRYTVDEWLTFDVGPRAELECVPHRPQAVLSLTCLHYVKETYVDFPSVKSPCNACVPKTCS